MPGKRSANTGSGRVGAAGREATMAAAMTGAKSARRATHSVRRKTGAGHRATSVLPLYAPTAFGRKSRWRL